MSADDAPAGVDYEQAWQHAACAHLLTDHAGTITHVNETFVAWTGRQRADVVGTALTALLPVGDRVLYSTRSAPQLAIAGRVEEVSLQVVDAAGTRHAALLTATRRPADLLTGRPAQVSVALFSAGARRRYEEDLLAARRRAEASEAQRARAEAGLQHLVHHDALTGLLNRSGLLERMRSALAVPVVPPVPPPRAPRRPPAPTRAPLAVLYIDLDGFKSVNDSLGHAAGDELLRVVAARLRAAVRDGTVIARLAGDEYAVVERATADHAAALAQRLLAALDEPVALDGVEVVLSASIGIALHDPAPSDPAPHDPAPSDPAPSDPDGSGAEDPDGPAPDDLDRAVALLLRRADAAMYRAKARGRSQWVVHEPGLDDAAADRLRLLEQLRHAVAEGQLRLHYQPRTSLRTGRLHSVEALVRWAHPTRGLLPPAEFIVAAEESGLVRELGAWVLEEALGQVVRWDAGQDGTPGGAPVQVAVNLSARQLADPLLLARVSAALQRHGLGPSRLVLEITETALMSDPDAALATLRGLKALGVHLAVDDFGTGYSSFTYLKRFPVDELKIDQSFVAGMLTDPADRAIVASCIDLARAMGLTSVAEGVETAEQQEALAALGCDLGQGYHLGRPAPADALAVTSCS